MPCGPSPSRTARCGARRSCRPGCRTGRGPASGHGPAGPRRGRSAPPGYGPWPPAALAAGRSPAMRCPADAAAHTPPAAGRPARTGRRYGAQLPHPGRQSGRLGVDHAGRRLLPEPVPRLIGRHQPPRSRSASRSSNSCAPPVIRSARRSARRRAASGSAGPADGAPSVPARFSACSTERLRRSASHSPAQSGTSLAGRADSPDAQTSSSPSACLHGNFRLGQLHLYAGPVMSITVTYGLLPLPLHCPHTAPEPSHPPPDHGPAEPSLLPALRDASSGARASTCSTVQRATGAAVRKGSPREIAAWERR